MGKGATTREAIVSQALDRAVQVGLSGLSLGPLADDLNLSKSGLFAHFKSKEALQLAVLQEAIDRFTDRVVEPGLQAPRGRARMEALMRCWFDWIEGEPGMRGCLFSVAAQEYDDQHENSDPGPEVAAVNRHGELGEPGDGKRPGAVVAGPGRHVPGSAGVGRSEAAAEAGERLQEEQQGGEEDEHRSQHASQQTSRQPGSHGTSLVIVAVVDWPALTILPLRARFKMLGSMRPGN